MSTTLEVNRWDHVRRRLGGLPDGEGINIAHEAVDRRVADGHGGDIAIRFLGEHDDADAAGEVYTYQRLATETSQFAHALTELGRPARGDRVPPGRTGAPPLRRGTRRTQEPERRVPLVLGVRARADPATDEFSAVLPCW